MNPRSEQYLQFLDRKVLTTFGGIQTPEFRNWEKKISPSMGTLYLRVMIQRRLAKYPANYKIVYLNRVEYELRQKSLEYLAKCYRNSLKSVFEKYPFVTQFIHSGFIYGSNIYSPHIESDLDLGIVFSNPKPHEYEYNFTPEYYNSFEIVHHAIYGASNTRTLQLNLYKMTDIKSDIEIGTIPILAQPHRVFFQMKHSQHARFCKYSIDIFRKYQKKIQNKLCYDGL